jgi:carbohydrate-binding DOMON domain-containing protein
MPTPTETPTPTPTPTETPTPTQTIIIREFSDPPPRLPISGLKSFQRNVRNSRRRSI